uniref:Major facilitator superfamily (MFS) profile domain-containing protein n=1 Tax=Anopheles epiroticus TaxID=199890 RepID=A0A182PFL3_9DIPT
MADTTEQTKQTDVAVYTNGNSLPSDKEIMDGMLQVRFLHAKKQDRDYSHLFRKKSRLELIRLSMVIVGIEFLYAAETAFVTPILLGIGLSHTFMTMVWAFSPILGFFFAPMIASFSDTIRLQWGRRRPVLLALGLAMMAGMWILPHGKTIGIFFGDPDVPVDQMEGFRWSIPVTIIGLVMTDFDAETSNGIARAYFMDSCAPDDQARVLTTAMFIGGLGGTAGYVLGAIDWSQTNLDILGSNEATVFMFVFIVMGVGLLVTLTSYREVPLPLMERDPLLRPINSTAFEAEKARQLAVYSISKDVLPEPIKPDQDATLAVGDDDDEKPLQLRDFVRNIVRMPKSLFILYSTQFFSQLGYLSYCLYFTDFVGAEVFGGDVSGAPGSPELALYEDGVRYGCWGMAVFAVCSASYSAVIERLVKKFGARPVYMGGLLLFSLGMLLMGLVKEKFMIFISCPTVGIMYATMYSLPYLLVSQYHSKNSFEVKDGKCVPNTTKRGFGADVSMMSSMLFLAQLIISLAIGSIIDAVETNVVVIFSASIFSLIAALIASQIQHEWLTEDDILQGMLDRRHHFAKLDNTRGYQHTFRKKSKWELVRLSLLIVGIECTYATETALVAPILLGIGLPHTLMTMIWATPSIAGLLFAPVIASISDRLRSRWGRRRPVMLALGVTILTGMLILPNGTAIGELLGLRSVGWVATITTVGLIMSDFSAETSNGMCRTYAMEVCTIRDQARVLSIMVLTGGIGATMGALFGAIDWNRLGVGHYLGGNDASVFAANWVVLFVGLSVTLTSFAEIPLPVQEAEPMLRPVTQKMLLEEVKRVQGDEGLQGGGEEEVQQVVGFRQFVQNVLHMPRSMKVLCLTQLLSHMSYLTYCLYYTDFVGATVYQGDVRALKGSPGAERYDEGVRFACLGMALCSTTSSIYSVFIEGLIGRFGARPVYVGGLLAHCCGMLAMGLVPHRLVVFACCSLTGVMYATIYSMPFLLISHYHSKNCFTEVNGQYIESIEPRGFGVDVSMMSSMLCLAQLIVSLAIGAVIDAVGSTIIITFISSAFMLCAACSAMAILYMGL